METNAHQELAPSVKIAEVILSDGRFATVFKPRMHHLIKSNDPDPIKSAVKLLQQVTLIDDKAATLADILNLYPTEFTLMATKAIETTA